ncbi:MAG: hypothetical protein RR659_03215 [Bacilli bacterium]
MQIGIYINDKWVPAILTLTDGAMIIKYEQKSLIITYLEIGNAKLEEEKYISIDYMERQNGEIKKRNIDINSNDVNSLFSLILNHINTKETNNEDNDYVPPITNIYNNEVPKTEEPKITEDNVKEQQELNLNMEKPKKGIGIGVLVFASLTVFLFATYFIKTQNLNTSETLINKGTTMWTNSLNVPFIGYKFFADKNCAYLKGTKNGLLEDKCTYKVENHKIIIKLNENEKELTYNWNIKYKIKRERINIQVLTVLTLDNGTLSEYMYAEPQLNN